MCLVCVLWLRAARARAVRRKFSVLLTCMLDVKFCVKLNKIGLEWRRKPQHQLNRTKSNLSCSVYLLQEGALHFHRALV